MGVLLNRRALLKGLCASTLGLGALRPNRARAQATEQARRLIVFYFPDGVAGDSQEGDRSLWHARGSEHDFSLPALLEPLEAHRDDCVFFNGLSMGPADNGSHPGGAKKLLTAHDGGWGTSIDKMLAQTVGQSSPHRHLYLGVMANHNGASGDKHISYASPGQTVAPEDNPVRAFSRLFGQGPVTGEMSAPDTSVIDGMLADLDHFKSRLGDVEQRKLSVHLEALREVENRIKTRPEASLCGSAAPRLAEDELHRPERFVDTLEAQLDLVVEAMACDLTRVSVVQMSHHTSELIMSRFPGTPMHDPGFDMRSHQASHYGPRHDYARREFSDFVLQRQWFVAQFAGLLERLKSRPEGDGTMLDNSLVLLASEVSDGNTHSHDNMPFVLAGRGEGRIRTGRLLERGGHRHGELLLSLAHAMNAPIDRVGDSGHRPLPGLLA